jgi:hypothetical protein
MLQVGSSLLLFPMWLLQFLKLRNSTIHALVVMSTRPVIEISTRNFPAGKGWPARKADNFTPSFIETSLYIYILEKIYFFRKMESSTSQNPVGLRCLLLSYVSLKENTKSDMWTFCLCYISGNKLELSP